MTIEENIDWIDNYGFIMVAFLPLNMAVHKPTLVVGKGLTLILILGRLKRTGKNRNRLRPPKR